MKTLFFPMIVFILGFDFYISVFRFYNMFRGNGLPEHNIEYLRRHLLKKSNKLNCLYRKDDGRKPHLIIEIIILFQNIIIFIILFIFSIISFFNKVYINQIYFIQEIITYSYSAILLITLFFDGIIEGEIICRRITLKYSEDEIVSILENIRMDYPNIFYPYIWKKEKKLKKKQKKCDLNDNEN